MSPPKKKNKPSLDGELYDFSTLPYEILIHIFKYLDFKTIAQCATLCQIFYNISKESVIYNKVVFKYNMDKQLMENYISKIRSPKHLTIEYKFFDNESKTENYTAFDDYVVRFLNQSGASLTSIHVKGCRNDNILSLISECPSLTDVTFFQCKGTFQSLPLLRNLRKIDICLSVIPNKVVEDTLKNNLQLNTLCLSDNSLNANNICESLAKYNPLIEEVHFGEKQQVRAKGLKALAKCCKLKVLELIGGPYHCDPEDCLQQLAAGCPHLERLTLYGWKDINDDNLLPILHSCTQLREVDLRGISITIKSCREAALSLPFLHTLDVYKCSHIKKAQILKLQNDFKEIRITN